MPLDVIKEAPAELDPAVWMLRLSLSNDGVGTILLSPIREPVTLVVRQRRIVRFLHVIPADCQRYTKC